MKKRRIIGTLIALALMVSLTATAYAGTTYKAIIVQGNTKDVGDCKVFYNKLKAVPDGNNYVITNRGWHFAGPDSDPGKNSYHNYDAWPTEAMNPEYALASAQDLINAKDYDVLYWSGHGGPAKLNVHPANRPEDDYGPGATMQPEIDIGQTLCLDTNNWASTSKWNKSSRLKVAIFAACSVLDESRCTHMVRAMKASNVRVIAGYHKTSPSHPKDTNIATAFFSYGTNDGVLRGQSIRNSWQVANELYGVGDNWAVLCYQSNSNQYYRMPGFPGNTYAAPASNATVYRFWKDYPDPNDGQLMTTGSADDALPLEITVSNGNGRSAGPVGATVYREMNDDHQGSLDNETQRGLAEDYIDEKYQSGIEGIGTVYCEEVDEETGVVPGTVSEVGKTFCYSNQYSGIRLVDNFYKVATDATGVYFTIDRWKDVAGSSEATTGNTPVLSADSIAVPCAEGESVAYTEMVYMPVSATTYRLCYEVTLSDGSIYYVNAVTGETVDLFVEDLGGDET